MLMTGSERGSANSNKTHGPVTQRHVRNVGRSFTATNSHCDFFTDEAAETGHVVGVQNSILWCTNIRSRADVYACGARSPLRSE